MIRTGRGFAPGSCGELVQGVTTDGEGFQVSLPIALGTTIVASFEESDEVDVVAPPALTKLVAGVVATLDLLGVPPQLVHVRRTTDLPVAKGLASSTADIVAAARATARAFGEELTAAELATLAGSIEPSDGSMYPGMALLRRRGLALRRWTWTPTFTALVLVPLATVVTEDAPVERLARAARRYDRILEDLERGAKARDRDSFLLAAAMSAEIHHELIGNQWTAALPQLAAATGALGWNLAHTGSVAGILFEPTRNGWCAAHRAAICLRRHFDVRTIVTAAG